MELEQETYDEHQDQEYDEEESSEESIKRRPRSTRLSKNNKHRKKRNNGMIQKDYDSDNGTKYFNKSPRKNTKHRQRRSTNNENGNINISDKKQKKKTVYGGPKKLKRKSKNRNNARKRTKSDDGLYENNKHLMINKKIEVDRRRIFQIILIHIKLEEVFIITIIIIIIINKHEVEDILSLIGIKRGNLERIIHGRSI